MIKKILIVAILLAVPARSELIINYDIVNGSHVISGFCYRKNLVKSNKLLGSANFCSEQNISAGSKKTESAMVVLVNNPEPFMPAYHFKLLEVSVAPKSPSLKNFRFDHVELQWIRGSEQYVAFHIFILDGKISELLPLSEGAVFIFSTPDGALDIHLSKEEIDEIRFITSLPPM